MVEETIKITRCSKVSKEKKEIIENILTGVNLTLEEYINYAYSNDIDIAMAVAISDKSPIQALTLASIDKDPKIRCAVCENKNITDELLFNLSKDKNIEVSSLADKIRNERYSK